jgi:3-methyladenine DNA glycosylase AlkC
VARGPDGQGGGAGTSLADQLFNARTLGALAAEFAVLPGFDAARFHRDALAGLAARGLMARLEHVADCLEPQLAADFPTMADQIEAALPPPLDPDRTDGDFGRFIHAVPGVLAVRHGLARHPERALDLLHAATRRFSMEFHLRPFLDRWSELTLARLPVWAEDENYHVRRLVSEGTRPRLPWGRAIALDPRVPLGLLDRLHADPTRFVTRSVANHLNDVWKIAPEAVHARLADWRAAGRQTPGELDWMTRHALRSAVKAGAPDALALLGYVPHPSLRLLDLRLAETRLPRGAPLVFEAVLAAEVDLPVVVDYVVHFVKADGRTAPRTFKLKRARLAAGRPLTLGKTHKLKWDATTFRLHPGTHRLQLQVNGVLMGDAAFELSGEPP